MTIEIEIRNRDTARLITVQTVDYDKRTGRETRSSPYVVHPGLNFITTVHALRDIVVTEEHPDMQGRPAFLSKDAPAGRGS